MDFVANTLAALCNVKRWINRLSDRVARILCRNVPPNRPGKSNWRTVRLVSIAPCSCCHLFVCISNISRVFRIYLKLRNKFCCTVFHAWFYWKGWKNATTYNEVMNLFKYPNIQNRCLDHRYTPALFYQSRFRRLWRFPNWYYGMESYYL